MITPVILSGGSGTRLWPLSRKLHPKQLLPLLNETSLLQDTINRLQGLNGLEPTVVICNEEYRFMVADKKVRLGVIGCGYMAQGVHIPCFTRIEDCQLWAVADDDVDLARRVARRWQIPNVFENTEDLLRSPEIDAAATLVPAAQLLNEPIVLAHPADDRDWDDETINILADKYSVSREVIVRKLLTLNRTTETFYRAKRQEYHRQLEEFLRKQKKPSKGFESPAGKVVSTDGQGFVKLVLECYHHGNITLSDASSYLGVRIKHIPTIEQRVLAV